jgi:hypothetical protein
MTETRVEKSRRLSREAKRRRTGTCIDCGAVTRYAGKSSAVSTRCPACGNRALGLSKRGKGVFTEAALAAMRERPLREAEVAQAALVSRGYARNMIHRLTRYGLIERVERGLYRTVK